MPHADPEARKAYMRAYNKRTYAVRKESIRAYERRRRAENPEVFVAQQLRRRYGLTIEQYKAILAAQNGMCALCKEREAVDVDHDHKTGKVRSLLCRTCNLALGFFRDCPDRLRAAIAYLKEHGCG